MQGSECLLTPISILSVIIKYSHDIMQGEITGRVLWTENTVFIKEK